MINKEKQKRPYFAIVKSTHLYLQFSRQYYKCKKIIYLWTKTQATLCLFCL